MVASGAHFEVSRVSVDRQIAALLQFAQKSKKRRFVESVDLQCRLKNLGKGNQRYTVSQAVPYEVKAPKLILIANQSDLAQYKSLEEPQSKTIVQTFTVEEIKMAMAKKKGKDLKHQIKACDALIASKDIMVSLPKLIGPILGKTGKFPFSINNSVQDTITQVSKTIKMAQKKSLLIAGRIGNTQMTENQLKSNVFASIGFVLNALPKGWENIGSMYLRSTMGKPHLVYKS
ncbi:MAG: 60S ribosomal protein L10A [Marteilia pararefringens]